MPMLICAGGKRLSQAWTTALILIGIAPAIAADPNQQRLVPPSHSVSPQPTQTTRTQNEEATSELQTEYKHQVLKEPVSLPDLPAYTGQSKFIFGISYPGVKSGASIGLRFCVKEDAAQVIDWYRTALHGYKWTVTATQNGLTATKGDNSCTITLSKPTMVGYRADLNIGYKYPR